MINVYTYYTTYYLKNTQVFIISLKNLQYQVKKEAKVKIDPKNIVSKEYHDFLNTFSKKNSNIFF